MRSVLIIGAGQSGLQLGHGLLAAGYDVTIMSARTPHDIRTGRPASTQSMWEPALALERRLGLNPWEQQAPPISGFHLALSSHPGQRVLDVLAPLDHPGRSVDQRLKMSRWLELLHERGATVLHRSVSAADLDALTADDTYDLVVVAAGRGELVDAFALDPVRTRYQRPPRTLAAAYVHGLAPNPLWPQPHVQFAPVPGVGELFVIPALTLEGPCDILFWEAIPGSTADRWTGERLSPQRILDRILELAGEYTPWVADRAQHVVLTDALGALSGAFVPQVRRPVAQLPSGGVALGIGDVVTSHDPISGQGANLAAAAAEHYLSAVLDRGDSPFDQEWMNTAAEQFWIERVDAVAHMTHALLQPPPAHVQHIYATAAANPTVARRLANGFADPKDFVTWVSDPGEAAAYLASFQLAHR